MLPIIAPNYILHLDHLPPVPITTGCSTYANSTQSPAIEMRGLEITPFNGLGPSFV